MEGDAKGSLKRYGFEVNTTCLCGGSVGCPGTSGGRNAGAADCQISSSVCESVYVCVRG